MINRGKEGNLEIDAGRNFVNPNNDFTINMVIGAVILGIAGMVAACIESNYRPIENAYHFLVNHINYLN